MAFMNRHDYAALYGPTVGDGIVTQVPDQFGWEIADMGTVEAARAIEPLCILWCIPGFLRNEWAHAYKVLQGNPVISAAR